MVGRKDAVDFVYFINENNAYILYQWWFNSLFRVNKYIQDCEYIILIKHNAIDFYIYFFICNLVFYSWIKF